MEGRTMTIVLAPPKNQQQLPAKPKPVVTSAKPADSRPPGPVVDRR
jgi:hypothetical protein